MASPPVYADVGCRFFGGPLEQCVSLSGAMQPSWLHLHAYRRGLCWGHGLPTKCCCAKEGFESSCCAGSAACHDDKVSYLGRGQEVCPAIPGNHSFAGSDWARRQHLKRHLLLVLRIHDLS